ncbi:AMP-binding protein [Kerstersia similis]|uniref:AMP-binding protein n=1 Tax=Kerstersia similis TaxID=206505 RepID=UPI0039EF6848
MEVSAHVDTFARDNLPPQDTWPVMLDSPDTRYAARLNCAVELVDRHISEGRGENIALRWQNHDGTHAAMNYRELQALTNRMARVLIDDMKLVPGNRILLRGANHPLMAAAWLAAVKAGLVTVPTMPLLRAKELKQVIEKAQISAMLCDARLAEEAEYCRTPGHEHYCESLQQICFFNQPGTESLEARAAAQPDDTFTACDTAADDVCLIAFTSGTTGMPKGCMHFHRDVLAMCDLFAHHILQPGPDDIFCGTPPLAFTFGLGGLLCFPLRVGASVVLAEKLSPASLLQTVQDFRVSIVFTAPTFYRQMAALAGNYDLSSLRRCVSAGEALPDATRQLWKEASGIEMIDGIGGTEMIHVFISSRPETVRRGAIGQVVPGYEACIVDAQMQPVPDGTPGRLALRGPTGCRYLADDRQKVFVQQGWNLPGDVFVRDKDGYFFYQARNDDMIVSAGYNIAGPEVEDALLRHPAVAECGVIGWPDDLRGQVVKAYIVLKTGHAGNDAMVETLQRFVKESVAPYKYPRLIEFVESLPRTETGKLRRFALRQEAH